MAEGWRQSLKLHGAIELGLAGSQATLTDVEVERRDETLRLKLAGPLSEVRRLATMAPASAELLRTVADAPETQRASLSFLATPGLVADFDAAVAALGEGALPEAWLRDERVATLIFAFPRYEVESVGLTVESA